MHFNTFQKRLSYGHVGTKQGTRIKKRSFLYCSSCYTEWYFSKHQVTPGKLDTDKWKSCVLIKKACICCINSTRRAYFLPKLACTIWPENVPVECQSPEQIYSVTTSNLPSWTNTTRAWLLSRTGTATLFKALNRVKWRSQPWYNNTSRSFTVYVKLQFGTS